MGQPAAAIGRADHWFPGRKTKASVPVQRSSCTSEGVLGGTRGRSRREHRGPGHGVGGRTGFAAFFVVGTRPGAGIGWEAAEPCPVA